MDARHSANSCESDQSRGTVASTPGPRYERSQPNELWHIDIKGPFFIQLAGRGYLKTWLFGLVDDHSRLFLASEDPVPINREFTAKEKELDLKYGVVSINEDRMERGLEPVAWGWVPWLPVLWAPTDKRPPNPPVRPEHLEG